MVFIITSLISSIFMLFGLSIFDVAKGVNISLTTGEVEKVDVGSQIVKALTVTDFGDLFSRKYRNTKCYGSKGIRS